MSVLEIVAPDWRLNAFASDLGRDEDRRTKRGLSGR